MKKHPDGNLEKTLANLENHPALFKRCFSLYLEKILEKRTCVEIAEKHGIHVSTVSRYIEAYKKAVEKYADTPTVSDVLAFCHAEIARLLQRRKEVETAREYKDLTGEIRQFQDMINEIGGLINRKSEVNVTVLNNVVTTITEVLPGMLEANIGKPLTQELINEILNSLAQKLEETSRG